MSSPPAIAPDDQVIRDLLSGKYDIEIYGTYLIMHNVPYLDAQGIVCRGALVSTPTLAGDIIKEPQDHTILFAGEFPCSISRTPMSELRQHPSTIQIYPGLTAAWHFSNKPLDATTPFLNSNPNYRAFTSEFEKLTHYAGLVSAPATYLEPNVTANIGTGDLRTTAQPSTAFHFLDTATPRAGLGHLSAKLKNLRKVALVGVGGTNSYVLDHLAKTEIPEIHLYDAKPFGQHSAFRAPGAFSKDDVRNRLPKATHYANLYSAMRNGIIGHPDYVTAANLGELDDMDFVFIAVDRETARREITTHLLAKGIPFIDCGMGLQLAEDSGAVYGLVRTTICTPDKNDHLDKCARFKPDGEDDDLYGSNIQISEMNALNAAIAVYRFKQYLGIYHDIRRAPNQVFTISEGQLLTSGNE